MSTTTRPPRAEITPAAEALEKAQARQDAEDIEASRNKKPLLEYIDAGLILIPSIATGAPVIKWKGEARRKKGIQTIKALQAYWSRGYRRFQFIPADAGFIVIDLDNKNGKDGKKQFAAWYPYIFPRVFTETPNNGRHIYFKVDPKTEKDIRRSSGNMGYGIEVIWDNHPCTAGGSSKTEGIYRFYGKLDHAPSIKDYPELLDDIKATLSKKQPAPHPPPPPRRRKYQQGKKQLSLEQIADTLHKQGISIFEGRNNFCYEFAKYASKQGHTDIDTIGYLQAWLEAEDFPRSEIKEAVNSGYRGKA